MADTEAAAIDPKAARREMLFQLIRYGINGVLVTALQSVVYWTSDQLAHLPLQVCNFLAYVAAVCTGYVLHSRVTFKGRGERGIGAFVRFVLASLPGYALNAFWVWLLATALHLPSWTPIVPFLCVTPFMLFAINRWWVFK